jgi:hypothetical protein
MPYSQKPSVYIPPPVWASKFHTQWQSYKLNLISLLDYKLLIQKDGIQPVKGNAVAQKF